MPNSVWILTERIRNRTEFLAEEGKAGIRQGKTDPAWFDGGRKRVAVTHGRAIFEEIRNIHQEQLSLGSIVPDRRTPNGSRENLAGIGVAVHLVPALDIGAVEAIVVQGTGQAGYRGQEHGPENRNKNWKVFFHYVFTVTIWP